MAQISKKVSSRRTSIRTEFLNARDVLKRLTDTESETVFNRDGFRILGQDEEPKTEEQKVEKHRKNRRRMDSLAYNAVGKKLFGLQDWKRDSAVFISPSDEKLLDGLVFVKPNSLVVKPDTTKPRGKMPPGQIPNPSKKKVRPSSAAANLKSHEIPKTSLYGDARPSTAAIGVSNTVGQPQQRPKTHAGGPRYWGKGKEAVDTHSASTDSTPGQRRNTVGPTDGIGEKQKPGQPKLNQQSVGKILKGKIEEKISIDTLDALKRAFQTADEDGSGALELEEFKKLMRSQLRLPAGKEAQIDALFQKIDWSSEGSITWDEFCTYMQLEYAEKEDSYQRTKDVDFHLPAKIKNVPHSREPILRLTDTSDGTFMACSQDGIVSFWSPGMELKRHKSIQTSETPGIKNTKTKWITDFTIMHQFNKFIVTTGDREIQFFELSSFEPYCQINSLETVPLRLDYCGIGDDECIILYGDGDGCINIIHITSVGECLRLWKKAPKADGMPFVGIDNIALGEKTKFIRWKVHGDWVQQLKYYHDVRQVISCSNHSNTAIVIGGTMGSTDVNQQLKEIKDPNQSMDRSKSFKSSTSWMQAKTRLPVDEIVFKVYKGVKCFHFSKSKNVLVTGGMDRIVRMWNPYVAGKSTGMLRGHNAPIFFLFIAEEENRIFSISTDKCIKIWDIQDQNCLITIRPKGHKIRGDLQACHYSNISKTLAVATDQMNGLQLKLKSVIHADIPITHKEPIHAIAYNPSFKQLITCSDGSVIKVWDLETGNAIFEYGKAHQDKEGDLQAITALTFDNTNRRLISGGRDGSIRVWNYNNGHCLRTLLPEKHQEEITDLAYVEMSKNRYILAVGWDKRINIYNDTVDTTIHQCQHPNPYWTDDLKNGHKEDILSVATAPPSLLATSSYDGLIIVWNLVSGHIFCRLRSPVSKDATQEETLNGELGINKVIFLRTRATDKDCGSLVSSGPKGYVHIWNVFNGGILRAHFKSTKIEGALVTAMETNKENSLLLTADSSGFLFIWNISDYATDMDEGEPPELYIFWRAHIENVTAVTLIEESKMVVTASLDCTVRMWTLDGEYVGTFGQPESWNVYNFGSYQHPMVPYDVLIDPLSVPDHPVFDEKLNDDSSSSEEESAMPTQAQLQLGRQQYYVDDDTIAKELSKKPYAKGTGKRLRHEKMKPIPEDRGGPSEYRMLKCYELEATPQPKPPKLRTNKDDPFDFYSGEQVEVYE